MQKTWLSQVFCIGAKDWLELDPDPAPLDAGIVDGPPEDFLAAGADVGHIEPQQFQAAFELFDGEVICVHALVPFV